MANTPKQTKADSKRGVELQIQNQRFLICGDETEDHVREVAELVRRKIESIKKRTPGMNLQKAAIVAAFEFASDSIKSKRKSLDFRAAVLTKAQEVLEKLENELSH